MRSSIKFIAMILPIAAAVLLLLLLLPLIYRRLRHRKLLNPTTVNPHTADSPSDAETQTHHHYHRRHRQAVEEESPHRRDTDPGLAAEAAEKGWSLFMFDHCTLCKTPSAFMQTVRLNPDASYGDDSICSTRMRFPLPGPPSVRFSFPQVAYFEITILYLKLQPRQAPSSRGADKRATAGSAREDDRTKLVNVNSVEVAVVEEPIKREEGQPKRLGLCLGLTSGDRPPDPWPPGTYPGSIGFQANGSIYLDGMKLVPEYSAKTGWAEANKVIGCGFDPSKKKVFFTVDSELVHVVSCASDAYKAPLFPAMAADTDVIVLVNLGRRKFKYELANAYRSPNPCAIVHEEKQVLFSEDRMKSDWIPSAKKDQSSRTKKIKCEGERVEFEADSDLFEISLN